VYAEEENAYGRTSGGNIADADNAAAAIEIMHSYSLVHDDLPAMDNDSLRRGKPSAHVAFGQANAILIGDALQSLAFEVIASFYDAEQVQQMVKVLAQSVGARGMVVGQMFDLSVHDLQCKQFLASNQDKQISKTTDVYGDNQLSQLDFLHKIHQHKTGALIVAAVCLGAFAAQEVPIPALHAYAKKIGLAFQIQDDILDVTASTQVLGKTSGKDEEQNKLTFVNLLGLKQSQEYAQNLVQEAKDVLIDLDGQQTAYLRYIADAILNRSN